MSTTLSKDEMFCYESVNMEALKTICDNFDHLYDSGAIGNLKDVKSSFAIIQDKKVVKTIIQEYYNLKMKTEKVEYGYSRGATSGRMFSKKICLQGLNRKIRHTIAGELYIDLDIVNAHPVILLKLCKTLKVDTPILADYIGDRDKYLTELMVTYNMDRDTAKAIPLAVINGGERAKALERESDIKSPVWLRSLQNEIKKKSLHIKT